MSSSIVVDYKKIFLSLFPEYTEAVLDVKAVSPNGVPIYVEYQGAKYWGKVLISSQLEQDLRDVERNALQGLDSEYVVKLHTVRSNIIDGERYDILLFDFIDGDDLAGLIKKKLKKLPFSEDEVLKLLTDITEGINVIWSRGWVHQDIKLKNLMFDKNNKRYVLLDFGIAHYAKDFNYSSGRHNKDCVSPEQILASIGEKVPVTFNSDLFQLGTIAYELLTEVHPFKDQGGRAKLNLKRIREGDYISLEKVNPNLSPKIVSIVNKMLNPHSGYRYVSPKQLLAELRGTSYSVESQFREGVYFQTWPGPQGYKNILEYDAPYKPAGVVISASQMPSDEYVSNVHEQGYMLLFDPETFLLCDTVKLSWHGSMIEFPWYFYPLTASYFRNPSNVKTFVAGVVQSHLTHKCDYIVPPYFNIDNWDSEWRDVNALVYHETLKYCRRLNINLPFICAVSLSQNMITVDQTRKAIIDYYSQFNDVEAYMIRVDAKEHNISVPVIKATTQLINDLQMHKPVMLADANTVSFGYLANGLSSLSTSLADSKRMHDLDSKFGEKKSGGSYKEKFFVPSLLQFVNVEGDLGNLIRILGKDALCTCTVCSAAKTLDSIANGEDIETVISRWSKADKANHFLCCLIEWKNSMRGLSLDERLTRYKSMLSNAEKIFNDNRDNLIFVQMFKQKLHIHWQSAFFSQ